MADPAALELVAKAQVPFYFKTNDKVAWLTRENVNVVAIAHTSVFMENDFNRGASKKAQINLKLLNMDTGETETELGYVLVFPCPVLEIVCDLTQTSGYPLLNVFARLEDFRSGLYVFSCPCDHKLQESKVLQKTMEVTLDGCNLQNRGNFQCGTSVRFLKVSALCAGRYWLGVIFNDGDFILYEMAVKEASSYINSNCGHFEWQVDCTNHISSSAVELNNVPFCWRLLDFNPDLKNMAVIGRGSYVFYIGLVFVDMSSFTVTAKVQLKGFHFVADAKYSTGGEFFLALCSGQQIQMHNTDGHQLGIDFEDFKAVLIWDTLGHLLHKINIGPCSESSLAAYELLLSPHDNYFMIPQSGFGKDQRQFSVFSKHTLNFSKCEAPFEAENVLQICHKTGTENYTSCTISSSGHLLLVTHCCHVNAQDISQDVSNLLVYKMKNSPTRLKVLCRVAVRKYFSVENMKQHEIPKDILSFLNWC